MLRLVHVDQDPDTRDLVRTALNFSGGYELASCALQQDLPALARRARADIALIDLDGLGGEKKTWRLLKDPQLRNVILILTGTNVDLALVRLYRSFGAVAVIQKPLDVSTLAVDILYLSRNRRISSMDYKDFGGGAR